MFMELIKPESLCDNRVWEVFEDSKERLWVGTCGGGLNLLDKETGNFIHFFGGNGFPSGLLIGEFGEPQLLTGIIRT